MSCPKTNPMYSIGATSREIPFDAAVRQVDPNFDRERRRDHVYTFDRAMFFEDALLHGAYSVVVASADFSSDFSSDFATDQATLDAAFKAANGFCDPYDDGTVFTGSGAGGANPGSVPSIGPNAGVVFKGA